MTTIRGIVMAEESKVFPRWVKDPLYSPVKRFLRKRHELVTEQGDIVDRQLADVRYSGMKAEDFIIERVHTGPDNVKRVCLTRRSRNFARVDLELEQVSLRDVLTDFGVAVEVIMTFEDFIEGFKRGTVQGKVLFLAWRNSIGVCLPNRQLNDLQAINDLFGDIFFKSMELSRKNATDIDPNTFTSGTVKVTDEAIGSENVIIYVSELIREELGLNDIQHNIPKNVNIQRGQEARHNLKLTIGDVDVTTLVDMTFSPSNRLVIERTDNKLEMVIKAFRGSATEDFIEEIQVNMIHSSGGFDYDTTAKMIVKIQKDTPSDLTLYGYPLLINAPTGAELGIVVKAKFKGAPIKLATVPEYMTSMLHGVSVRSKGEYKGGVLYTGPITNAVTDGVLLDLLIGTFRHTVLTEVYTAKCFIDLEITKAIPGYGRLTQVKLDPNGLTGKKGETLYTNYIAAIGGKNIPTEDMDFPVGEELGPKKLIQLTRAEPNRLFYEVIRDSGQPGVMVTDTVGFKSHYVSPQGTIWWDQLYVYPNIVKDSVISVIPLSGENIIANRYDGGGLPVKVLVNGEERTRDVLIDFVTTPGKEVVKHIDPYTWDKTAWLYIKKVTEEKVVDVKFDMAIGVDNGWRRFSYTKKFTLKPYDGPDFLAIPNLFTLDGKRDDKGVVSFALWNDETRFTDNHKTVPAFTTTTGGLQIGVPEKVTGKSLDLPWKMIAPGSHKNVVAFTRNDITTPTEAQVAKVTIDSTVKADENILITHQALLNWQPYEVESMPMSLSYDDKPVAIDDPNVQIEVTFDKTWEGVVNQTAMEKRGTDANGLLFFTNRDAYFSTDDVPFTIRATYTAPDGKVTTHSVVGNIEMARPPITDLVLYPDSEGIEPIKMQRIKCRIEVDGEPLQGAAFFTLSMKNKDPGLPVIQGYSNSLIHSPSAAPGVYYLSVSTSHLGGEFWPELVVTIAKRQFNVRCEGTYVCPEQPVNVLSVTEGTAVNNATSTVKFVLRQDRWGGQFKVMKGNITKDVVKNDRFFQSVGQITGEPDPSGYTTMTVTSTGEAGTGDVSFTFTDQETSLRTKDWRVTVPINMVK
ncbi:hypothetical protein D6_0165 [Aeromonas phage D6]|uniref:Uncharacterized protein n=1 Tax=Aeromonas phage D6 TaxID=2593322 RepID=A0ACD0UHB3_9CAUD|nr:hypothetical protein PQC08_gp110 [Aeromonas phage D6]QDJ97326.2 hypothetical protein D6_0165 [Aeromonas phage D6]